MSSTLQLQHLWGDSPQQGSMSRHRAPRSAPLTQVASRFLPPHLLLLVSMFSVQLGAALAKSLFPALGSMGTVFLRLTLASLMLLPARIFSVLLSLEPVVGALIPRSAQRDHKR
jgi:threonine/homoserine efflux transporter RhtA